MQRQGFFRSRHIDVLASGFRLLEHLRTAGTAAQSVFPTSLHFQHFTLQRSKNGPRSFVFTVRPTQITGVVVHDFLALKFSTLHAQAAGLQQFLQELGVVLHRIVTAERRILVFQGIEAVGTCRDQRLNAVGVEHFDVLKRLHLEQEFVARAFGGIPGAPLFGAQDGKGHTGLVQQARKGLGDFLGAVVKTTGASGPKDHFRQFASSRKLRDSSNG